MLDVKLTLGVPVAEDGDLFLVELESGYPTLVRFSSKLGWHFEFDEREFKPLDKYQFSQQLNLVREELIKPKTGTCEWKDEPAVIIDKGDGRGRHLLRFEVYSKFKREESKYLESFGVTNIRWNN